MFLKADFGIEVESLLYDNKHKPKALNKNYLSKNIILDFASNQVEVIPDISNSIERLVSDVVGTFDFLDEEYKIWPLSVPPVIDYEVEVADMDEKSRKYREYLLSRHSKYKLLQSGIHLNFSFDEEIIEKLHKQSDIEDYIEFKNNLYFKVFRNMYNLLPLVLYFNSHTPYCSIESDIDGLETIGMVKGFNNSMSIRNSIKYGYSNDCLLLDYSNLENFRKSLKRAIESGKIKDLKEDYSKLRLKSSRGSILDNDIDYIEIRSIDLNPYSIIDDNDIKFIHTLFVDSLFKEFKINDCCDVHDSIDAITLDGLNSDVEVFFDGQKVNFYNNYINYLAILAASDYLSDEYKDIIREKISVLNDYSRSSAYKIKKVIDDNNYTIFEFGKKILSEKDGM